MSFRDAVEIIAKEQANKILGENNHPALNLEGLGDHLVGLFFGLVRRKREEELSADIQQILDNGNTEEIKNLFILAFQTRWCRGGKGEKHLFYIMFCKLYQKYPELCLDLLELVPLYGSWKDLRQLHYYYFMKNILNQDSNLCTNLFIKMENILEKKLRQDIE